jgi:hypothetical protein
MKLNYKTKLVVTQDKNHILPFYKYNNNIGFIPADINIKTKNKLYTTAGLMTLIVRLHEHKILASLNTNFTMDIWYNDLKFNKSKFISFYKACEKAI